jgi:hypothetical protein
MLINSIPVTLLLLIIVSSCTQEPENSKETKNKPEAATVKLYAQSRPGGEHFDFDMPIDKGLDKLAVVDQSETSVDESELVLGFSIENKAMAIPIKYLSGFEVANLYLDDNYLITWCPLVGSARIFEGNLNDDQSGFDFGRGLRENNLLIVDRKSNSVWNQLSCKSIQGDLKGQTLDPIPSIQSTWGFWLKNTRNLRS